MRNEFTNREDLMRDVSIVLSRILLMGGRYLLLGLLVNAHPALSVDIGSDKTLSPYFFVQSDNAKDTMPLKSTGTQVTISGIIADVEVTQVYKNESTNTLEAIYIFPGSTRAAVYAMRMSIGNRTIEAQIKERKTARETYEKALADGKTASLLEQQRSNVFQMNVGNILPGDEITVTLNYTELLVPENAIYEFVYPTVVGPRYSNRPADANGSNTTWVANPYLEEGRSSPFPFTFSCTINSGIPIAQLTSPSHEIDIDYTGKTTAAIKLKESTATGNRDVVIRYCLTGNSIQSGLLMNIGRKEDFFLLMLEPPQKVEASTITPREYIFLVDVSGSMRGFPIDVTKALVKDLFGSLRQGDFFNILFFAGSNRTLSEKSLPFTTDNVQKAITMIEKQQGGGGTELMPALRAAMSLPRASESISRSMIIVTDGFVDVEKDAFEYIRNNLHNGNVFAFGIGSSVNRLLIEGMARAGMGEPFVVINKEEAAQKSAQFRKYIEAPVLTDISVTFDGLEVSEVEPSSIPDLFAKKPVVLFGKYSGTPKGTITISGKAAGNDYRQTIRVSEGEVSTSNKALRYLWARHRIMSLADMMQLSNDDNRIKEITRLGLTYNLLTDYTSFVAVGLLKRAPGKPQSAVKQPVPLPQGVSNDAVGETSSSSLQIENLQRELEVPPATPTNNFKAPVGKRQQLMEKIRKLEGRRRKMRQNVAKKTQSSKPVGKSLGQIIGRYEKLLSNCTVNKSERCADVMYTLGGFYYDKSRDEYIKAREEYENKMKEYERNPSESEPNNPVPDYSNALKMYERLTAEYPEFPKLSEAYYQMGTIYQLMGDLDKTKKAFSKVVNKYPGSLRCGGSRFRLSDLCYLDHDNNCTLEHLEKIKESDVDIQTWEMVHYRKAEMCYNLGKFDKAINLFHSYVEKCDSGLYPKREFRDMSLEFMAIAFSDLANGQRKAFRFFKKIGPKPWEPYVLYTIGFKNRKHGKFDETLTILTAALNKFPYYKDAPVARQYLIDCYVVKKDREKANREREKLVDEYGPGSTWYEKNSGEVAVIEMPRADRRRALGNIARYYHALAQKKKSKELYKKALRRYRQYIDEFPQDQWRVYEYHYYVAEIYTALGDCENSAHHYNVVATADFSTYPEYKADIDTLGMDQAEIEKAKNRTDKGPLAISQEEAKSKAAAALENCRKKGAAAEDTGGLKK